MASVSYSTVGQVPSGDGRWDRDRIAKAIRAALCSDPVSGPALAGGGEARVTVSVHVEARRACCAVVAYDASDAMRLPSDATYRAVNEIVDRSGAKVGDPNYVIQLAGSQSTTLREAAKRFSQADGQAERDASAALEAVARKEEA